MCSGADPLTVAIGGYALSGALVSVCVAGMVGHGVLRPLLEARGLVPWRVLDSLGSTPLVLIGSAFVGGGAALLAAWGLGGCPVAAWLTVLASAGMVWGAVMMRLGLLALRKLV